MRVTLAHWRCDHGAIEARRYFVDQDDRDYFRDHLEAAEHIMSALLLLDRRQRDGRADLGGAAAQLDQALYDVIAVLKTLEPQGDQKAAFNALVQRQEEQDVASGERYDEWVEEDDRRTLVAAGLGHIETFFEKAEKWSSVLQEVSLRRTAINIELLLKMFLLDRGHDDSWLHHHVGQDLEKALECACRTGLPEQPTELTAFVATMNRHQREHSFGALARDSGNPLSTFEAMRLTKWLLKAVQEATDTDAPRLQ
jgi:hypothetical protein